ncbi:MAG: hypothetical protein H3C34_26115 [Caldilineaceae bacterium]|nr:hypothetical protein [Caldilineaceae bacterium]
MTQQVPPRATQEEVTAGEEPPASDRTWFGVTTTGIYCRPGCPARRPKPEHVRYFPSPAAAEAAGFRACKRCRPSAWAISA